MLFMELETCLIVESGMDLSSEQMAELRELARSRDVPADVALRARIVLWSGEGRRRKDIAELAGVAPLTVDRCKARYAERGLAGLEERRRGGPRTQVPPQVRARVIAFRRGQQLRLRDPRAARPSDTPGLMAVWPRSAP